MSDEEIAKIIEKAADEMEEDYRRKLGFVQGELEAYRRAYRAARAALVAAVDEGVDR